MSIVPRASMNNFGESENPTNDILSTPSNSLEQPLKMHGNQIAPINISNESTQQRLSDKDLEDTESKVEDNKVTSYAMFVLAILTIIRIATQWQQKSIGYFYGFSGLGEMAGNSRFEISSAYPEL